MERLGRRMRVSLVVAVLLSFVLNLQQTVKVQSLVPPKFDGFVYGDSRKQFNPNTVMIEAFLDPVCPDSRDAWPPLKQALDLYGPHRVSLVVHTFPLPYHDNAYITSRALHIIHKINSSATYPLLEKFFERQSLFYNQHTSKLSRTAVIDYVVDFVSQSLGQSYFSTVKAGFSNTESDIKTRIAFKYGCTRGVYGTPFFFVNGFALEDAGSAIDFSGWKQILEPLMGEEEGIAAAR